MTASLPLWVNKTESAYSLGAYLNVIRSLQTRGGLWEIPSSPNQVPFVCLIFFTVIADLKQN